MVAQFDDSLKPSIAVDVILSHPLPVWYEDVVNGRGNGIVSRSYNAEMGCFCGEDSWEGCVLNPEYWRSYERFKDRRIKDEVWTHRLVWENPRTREVLNKKSRARWISSTEILGEVVDDAETDLPWLAIFLKRFIIFALGVMTGYGAAALWPIQ